MNSENYKNPSQTVLGFTPQHESLCFSKLYKPYVSLLVIGFLWLLASVLITLLLPRLINMSVSLIETSKTETLNILRLFQFDFFSVKNLVIIIICLAIMGGVVRTLSRIFLLSVGRSIENDVRKKLFAHIGIMSSGFFARFNVGDLISHIINDSTNIRLTTGFAVLNGLNIAIVFLGTVPILFSINPYLATFALLPFPLVMLVTSLLSGKMFARTKEYQAALSDLSSHIQENLSAISVVRVFHQEKKEEEKFAKINQKNYNCAMKLAMIRVILFPLMHVVAGLSTAITLLFGGYLVASGSLSLGDFVEVNTRLVQLTWPAVSSGFIITMYHRGQASLERINNIMTEKPDIVDGVYQGCVNGEIEAKSLNVIKSENINVLADISFSLKKGQVLGIVGPSGSGKSTLVNALIRNEKVATGYLFYGQQEANAWNLMSLFSQVAVVPAEPFLFSLSVRKNIVFANLKASVSEIDNILEILQLKEEVKRFSNGLDTVIGERGITLSGGQRQRVAIARAVLAKPEILILDDCLSAVDVETEKKIISALKKGGFATTFIIISHRLSAIKHADEILVFDAGKIAQRGTHQKLLKQGGLYSALWGVKVLEESLQYKR